MGLSQGEYSAFINKCAFIPNIRSVTAECIWILALSINMTMSLFFVLGFYFNDLMQRYMKFSNNTASVPPSNTYMAITES